METNQKAKTYDEITEKKFDILANYKTDSIE